MWLLLAAALPATAAEANSHAAAAAQTNSHAAAVAAQAHSAAAHANSAAAAHASSAAAHASAAPAHASSAAAMMIATMCHLRIALAVLAWQEATELFQASAEAEEVLAA